jgi:membrane fusion protein, multidrug efflux system
MNKSIYLALTITIALTGWMASGLLTGAQSKPNGSPSEKIAPKPLMRVEVRSSTAHWIDEYISAKGHVEAVRTVTLRAETSGLTHSLAVEKGARVQAGATIVNLAMNDRKAQLNQALARVKQREADAEASRQLKEKSLRSTKNLQADEAALAEAQADLAKIRWEIGKTSIRAPFNGLLDNRMVELGDYVNKGDPIATIIDDSTLLITAQISQLAKGRLSTGQMVKVILVNDEELEGKLAFISSTAQEGTRSYRIEVRSENGSKKNIIGLSATLTLNTNRILAHKLPPSALGLDSSGNLIATAVNNKDQVITYPVTLIQAGREGVWVDGLPQQVDVIIRGHGFVVTGEKVIKVAQKGK